MKVGRVLTLLILHLRIYTKHDMALRGAWPLVGMKMARTSLTSLPTIRHLGLKISTARDGK